MNPKNDDAWKEAQRLCKLSDDDIRMARELGFQPKSLIKNIPSKSQRWKTPVKEWVRTLYEEKFARRQPAPRVAKVEHRPQSPTKLPNPTCPWAEWVDDPELAFDSGPEQSAPPSFAEIVETSLHSLRRQLLLRAAAQSLTISMSKRPEVQKVAAFGSVARPLRMEVPEFRVFNGYRVEVLHECGDLDLAVWMSELSRLDELKHAIERGLSVRPNPQDEWLSRDDFDVHLLDAQTSAYMGRLCRFARCPVPGERECTIPGCGVEPFLRRLPKFKFNPEQFEKDPKVVLFDRDAGFLVDAPKVEAQPKDVRPDFERVGGDWENDVPF